MTVITISRQVASGGDEIAARVAALLGYSIFDKALMAEMASEVGMTRDQIVDFSETDHRTRSLLDRLLGRQTTVGETRTWQEDKQGVRVTEVRPVTDSQAISMVTGVIGAAHRRGNVVIVGRGGQAVLKGEPGVLHVRIEAPFAHRVERLADQTDMTPVNAELEIEDRDRAAQDYVKGYHGVDPTDPMHYHLLINTGLLDLETAAEVIALAAQQMKPVPEPEIKPLEAVPFYYM